MLPLAELLLRITSVYLLRRGRGQSPWEGVPEGYRDLPIGRFHLPASLIEWTEQRPAVQSIVRDSLGDIPPRPPVPKVRILAIDQRNGYRIEKFVFRNEVDTKVPGYIAIPEGKAGPFPAILTMHGHGSSKDSMFGYSKSPQNVAEMLVRRGYVVLGIDNYFNGERRGKGPGGDLETLPLMQELSLFKLNLWLGRTLWGMMLRDEQIALDYLVSRSEVDPARIGSQGMSMGSTRAWWLGALDDRIKAVVAVACFTRYEDLIAVRELRSHGIYYFVPGLLKHFDSEGVMSLLAPRPFLALTGDSDSGSPVAGMKRLEESLSALYALYGKQEAIQSVIYPRTGHAYTEGMKQRMIEWFDKHL
jgi:dienelactone hydrolase